MTKVINIYRDITPELGRPLVGVPQSSWPEGYVYIGRPGKGLSGPWGNSISIGKACPVCGASHDREGTIVCYREMMLKRIVEDPELAKRIASLADKTLVCFCAPKPCHGDVLIELIERLKQPIISQNA